MESLKGLVIEGSKVITKKINKNVGESSEDRRNFLLNYESLNHPQPPHPKKVDFFFFFWCVGSDVSQKYCSVQK